MTLYNRYIIKNLLGPIIVFTVTLTGIIWLTQSLRFIDLIVNRGLSFFDFVALALLLVPSLLMIILPVSLFIAVIYAYNKMTVESELIVLRGAGLNHFSLAKPAIIVACLITLLSYALSLYILPSSYRIFKDKQAFIRDNYASLLLQEGVFNSPSNGLTIYLDSRDYDGLLKGILVHDSRDPEHPVTMMAEEGRLVTDEEGNHQFDLINGNRQEVNNEDKQLSLLNFDRYTLDISKYTETTPIIRWREPKERYMHELLWPEKKTPDRLKEKLKAEAHQRITWPLYNMILTLLALSALLSGHLNRRGQWKRILFASMVAIMCVSSALGINGLIAKYSFLALMPYVNLLLFSAIPLTVLLKGKIQIPAFLQRSKVAA